MAGTVVIGLGSPLMGDDGLGLVALQALRDRYRFVPEPEWVDGGTWGMNLLPIMEGAGRLLLLDAIRAGRIPGEIVVLEREALPMGSGVKLSPHQIDLQEVLALAALRGRLPQETVAIGIEPERVELGWGVGPVVAGSLDALVARVVSRLRAWGHVPVVSVAGTADAAPPAGG